MCKQDHPQENGEHDSDESDGVAGSLRMTKLALEVLLVLLRLLKTL
jgi:hypothetical protein